MSSRYDPRALRKSWELQQSYEVAGREWRFERMLHILSVAVPARPRILDLGCGTGSLSERVLRRLPRARVWAVDYDPVVLRIGREGLGRVGGRLTWLEADLRSRSWTDVLPNERFDAVVSSTALHWLYPRTLATVYHQLSRRLRPGGILINGDYTGRESDHVRIAAIDRELRSAWESQRTKGRALGWSEWWAMARRIPELAPQFEERDRRYATIHGSKPTSAPDAPASAQLRALKNAGFREAAVIASLFQSVILLGVR